MKRVRFRTMLKAFGFGVFWSVPTAMLWVALFVPSPPGGPLVSGWLGFGGALLVGIGLLLSIRLPQVGGFAADAALIAGLVLGSETLGVLIIRALGGTAASIFGV